jgi:hypothetical protein
LLLPHAIKKIKRWIQLAVEDLKRMHALGRAAGRRHNAVEALGQDCFVPEARGVIWDLRRLDEGIITPLDFEQPIDTHLSLAYLKKQYDPGPLQTYPVQELISQLMLGVRYKDELDLDLQIVLLPHLISFADGCKAIQEECESLVDKGWYSLHHMLPYLPFGNIPRGSTPKADGTHRPTSETGAPRKPKRDTEGVPVVPQNVAIKEKEWLPE